MTLSEIVANLKAEAEQVGCDIETLARYESELLSEGPVVVIQRLKKEQKRASKALEAFGETAGGKSSGKAKGKSATAAEVVAAITTVLEQRAVADAETLKRLAWELIAATGKNKVGFGNRFKQALDRPEFVLGPDGYRLAAENGEEKRTLWQE